MNKTAISWTDFSLNPIRFRNTEMGKVGWYCQKVSAGCAHCYAETLNNRFGAMVRYDVPSAAKGEFFLDMKMIGKLYKEKKPSRVFAFDMTDLFLDLIPDWMVAVCFYAFLDNPHHTFQLLTKRPERAVNWHERFLAAQQTDEFKALAHEHQATWGERTFTNPWGANIWMGTSVESGATTHRIETLRQVPAQARYISAEPLLGDWGAVDLSGIHQVIIGGESGAHMWLTNDQGVRVRNEARWMKMEWALGIKNQCVDQGAAVFFKQQSGIRTEMDTFMVEADGSRWKWEQYPHDLIPPRELIKVPSPFEAVSPFALEQDAAGIEADQCLRHAQEWESRAYTLEGFRADNAAIAAAYWYEAAARLRPARPLPPLREFAMMTPDGLVRGTAEELAAMKAPSVEPIEPLIADLPAAVEVTPMASKPAVTWDTLTDPPAQTTVANFNHVYQHWNKQTRQWDDPKFVYIGRYMPSFNLPSSIFANPFKIAKDTPENRAAAIEQYRVWIKSKLADPVEGEAYRRELEALRGKTLICWCSHPDPAKSKACHGHVLQELLGEIPDIPAVKPPITQADLQPPKQLSLFGEDEVPAKKTVYA